LRKKNCRQKKGSVKQEFPKKMLNRKLLRNATGRTNEARRPIKFGLITPNLPEAADLLGVPAATTEAGMRDQLRGLLDLCPAVLLKGGHLGGATSPDLLVLTGDSDPTRLTTARVETTNDHGTGCTLSSAIAALRPQRDDWTSAVIDAKTYLTDCLVAAERLDVGSGHGPVHHFNSWY